MPKIDCIKIQKDAILAFLKNPDVEGLLSENIKNKGTILTDKIKAIINVISTFNKDVGSWSIATPFEYGNQLKTIIEESSSLKTEFKSFNSLIKDITAIQTQIAELVKGFEDCYKEIDKYLTNLQNAITLLKLQQSNYVLNKDIGSEVHSFSIDNLPPRGFINLKGTGKRANGDELLIEIRLKIPSSKEGLPDQSFVIEYRSFIYATYWRTI